MVARAKRAKELTPVYPDRAEFGGRAVVIGPKGYVLLSLVLGQGGAAEMLKLGPTVYGLSEVSRNRIETQVWRINAKLAEIRCPKRLAVDSGRVVLV